METKEENTCPKCSKPTHLVRANVLGETRNYDIEYCDACGWYSKPIRRHDAKPMATQRNQAQLASGIIGNELKNTIETLGGSRHHDQVKQRFVCKPRKLSRMQP